VFSSQLLVLGSKKGGNEMYDSHFGPLITAVVTPFDEHYQVDVEQLAKLMEHLIDSGSTALVITGTSGEASTLNSIEKLTIWEGALDYVDEKIPIIVGVGTNNTKTTLHNIKLAEEVGVDALLIVAPYYNKPSQKGLLEHFRIVAESTKLPIILYNVPSRCGIELELATILELAKLPNIIGIKDSTGDTVLLSKLKERINENFLLYSGEDTLYLETLKLGGAGVISVASHLVGKSMKRIFELYSTGFTERAEYLDAKLAPFYNAIYAYPSPSPIKALLNEYGINVGGVRLPLVTLEAHEANALWENVKDLIDQ